MRMPRSGEIGPKHVVILGAGFGGLYAARALRRAPVRVTLIDQRNHHLFQPMLYQVATAALNPSEIAAPIRSILRRQKNTTVMLGEARSVDTRKKVVLLSHGEITMTVSSWPQERPIPTSATRSGPSMHQGSKASRMLSGSARGCSSPTRPQNWNRTPSAAASG